jgi:hypothetical protein
MLTMEKKGDLDQCSQYYIADTTCVASVYVSSADETSGNDIISSTIPSPNEPNQFLTWTRKVSDLKPT